MQNNYLNRLNEIIKNNRSLEQNLDVLNLSDISETLLSQFYKDCLIKNIENNSSAKKMKVHLMTNLDVGQGWGAFCKRQRRLISFTGIVKFPEYKTKCYRSMFRYASFRGLSSNNKGLSNNPAQRSIGFRLLLPYQIKWALQRQSNCTIVSTSNVPVKDKVINSAKASKVDGLIFLRLEKFGIYESLNKDITLFNTSQNVYKLKIDKYLDFMESLNA